MCSSDLLLLDISKSPNLAEGKKDEIRIAREKAIERIDYLNKAFNLGEGKTEVIPKKPAKILVKEISNNKQTISTIQNKVSEVALGSDGECQHGRCKNKVCTSLR